MAAGMGQSRKCTINVPYTAPSDCDAHAKTVLTGVELRGMEPLSDAIPDSLVS